jgi:sugar (pentulose or hexulose) kinase
LAAFPLLAGLDIGTTSVKALLMTVDGEEVAIGRAPTTWTLTDSGTEADPEQFVLAAKHALADALEQAPNATIASLGISSMAESGVLVDGHDQPLAPVIAWHDDRDISQLDALKSELGGRTFSETTGLPLWTQWSLTKHRWLRDHLPDAKRTVRRYNIAEWVVRRLGGDSASELSLASRTGWLRLQDKLPWTEALEWSGAPSGVLGALVTAGTRLGAVTAPDVPEALRGAALTVAGHDHQAAVIGLGAFGEGDEVDSCGTAEAILRSVAPGLSSTAIRALTDHGITVGWHAVRDRLCLLGATQGGLILQNVLAHLCVGRASISSLDETALAADPDASTIQVGRDMHDLSYAGSTSPGDVWAAATMLVTRQVREISEAITDAVGPRRDLIVTGGWSNSDALMRAKASLLGDLSRVHVREAGSRGAALLGGVAAELYAGYQDFPVPARVPFKPPLGTRDGPLPTPTND